MALLNADGTPVTRQIRFVLDAPQFCKLKGCDGFKLSYQGFQQGTAPNPLAVLCPTCKHMVRDNECDQIFLEQNNMLPVKEKDPNGGTV